MQRLLGGRDPLKGLLHLHQRWALPLSLLGRQGLPEVPRGLGGLPGQRLGLLHFLELH